MLSAYRATSVHVNMYSSVPQEQLSAEKGITHRSLQIAKVCQARAPSSARTKQGSAHPPGCIMHIHVPSISNVLVSEQAQAKSV